MIRILPVVFLIILISAGLIYWRFFALKSSGSSNLIGPKVSETQGPVEVPKTLPNATLEARVKVLEEALIEMVKRVNGLSGKDSGDSSINSRLNSIEASITDLKVQISSLGQTPTSATSSKPTMYIPLGAGGSWGDKDWYSTAEYEISLDPGNYPGYKGMVLEVTFRLVEAAGTGSVRLFNTSDNTSVSSQVDTTSTSFSLKTSPAFTLPSGSKTYKLQVKSSQGATLFIQSARIKVNF